MTRTDTETRHLSRGMERRWREFQLADEIMGKISIDLLAALQRRREATAQADGHKSGHQGSGGGELTSTESAALRGLPDGDDHGRGDPDDWSKHIRPDFISLQVEKVLEQFDIATKALREMDRQLKPILNAADVKQGRRSSIGQCNACGRDVPGTEQDRLKSGYCTSVSSPLVVWSGCYERWIRAERPDRLRFESEIRQQVSARKAEIERTGYGVDEIDHLVANGTLPAKTS